MIWKGLTELRDQSVRFGKVKIPAVVLMVYSTATYMLDLFAIFLDICTENKHIFLLGGMNLADEVDYPSGCDLLILPYAGYRDNLAKADQMMERLRPKAVLLDHWYDTFPPITTPIDTASFEEKYGGRIPVIKPEYRTVYFI